MSQTLKTQQPSDVTRPVQHTAGQGKGTQAMTDGNLASLTTVHTALTPGASPGVPGEGRKSAPRLLDQLTTMIYTHVARKGPAGVTSPLDLLADVSEEEVREAAAATKRLG